MRATSSTNLDKPREPAQSKWTISAVRSVLVTAIAGCVEGTFCLLLDDSTVYNR